MVLRLLSERLLSAMALCSMYEEVTLWNHCWEYWCVFLFSGMEGWREPRWRTPLRKSSRRITAKWLWATDLSSQNWTECHPCFPELVLRDGTGWRLFFFFFAGGEEGSVLFCFTFFFLIVNLSAGWLSLPPHARGGTHGALFGFCWYSISHMNWKAVYWVWTDSAFCDMTVALWIEWNICTGKSSSKTLWKLIVFGPHWEGSSQENTPNFVHDSFSHALPFPLSLIT